MRIYTYVIATDRGSAPNYDPPCTTLAICKPRIRHGAESGDLVLAFTGSNLSPEPHSVCWAGIVTEKMSFSEYWTDKRFATKKPGASATPDNIYKPTPHGLQQVPNSSHGPDHVPTDLGGQFVLIFARTWIFGASGPILPERFGLRMTGGRRNHRTRYIPDAQAKALIQWLNEHSPVTHPAPRARTTGGC